MFSGFMPDGIFDDIYAITPEFLLSLGVRGLILDIDNTLVTYDDPFRPKRSRGGLRLCTTPVSLQLSCQIIIGSVLKSSAGTLTVSGFPTRGSLRGRGFLPLWSIWGLTFPRRRRSAIRSLRTCGRRSGAVCVRFLVPPIKDKTTLFFRFKRLLERPVLHAYYRSHK